MTQMVSFETSRRSPTTAVKASPLGWAYRLFQEYRARTQLKGLLDGESRILDDIGVTRDEIRAALNLPYHRNAAQTLMYASRCRRREQHGF